MPAINPKILSWARETAGLSVDAAAEKLALPASRGRTASERLHALEQGDDPLSRPLLLKMAKVYRRPLLAFYLKEPPVKGDRGQDFRTLPERNAANAPLLDALVRDVRARQSMVRAALEDEEEIKTLPFVGSLSVASGQEAVTQSIKKTLGIDLATFRAQGSADAAFAFLRSKAEAAGVFVLMIGNLGSHHTVLDAATFRGFAIADPIAPFVVINDQDAKTAWSFTLLHELVHLWLGASGISGATTESAVEQFCNVVASKFLLPDEELNLLSQESWTDLDEIAERVSRFSEERFISRSLVLYRLFRAATISDGTWRTLGDQFRQEWRRAREIARKKNRAKDGGPSYYVVRRHKLGAGLLRFAARNIDSGAITPTKAAKILGVKPRSVAPLLRELKPVSGRAA